ncbi:hypothetical protein SDRG_12027 [Saprolegnia diclina VS20]|uniref:Fungal lipase-type domain-containing protein n=1 Tax=Saprolegnia diclina (strain VS20) TaxID=1156394 RepID=T0Q9L7_SAPDV|nr:hypothetical protein SDRG_12027 [Saprolegnia diclina VS20]EQC30175.1 hypothetical protein SDRG_12027 [Saprolegnia diclina VS20]|eukprot:XP_008616307.1 hypothetical protein SDRG_12027 [Saprolegnia diclina VS20]
MTWPSPCDHLTIYEYNTTLRLSALTYTAKPPRATYSEFKVYTLSELKTKLNLSSENQPFVAYAGEKIRVIVATIASVAYVAITGTNSPQEVLANFAVHAQQIVPRRDAHAPTVYLKDVRGLGIVRLARALLEVDDIQKVILCGHSRGGSIAHTAHYELISDPRYFFDKTKLLSVAFGSTPFLKSDAPNVDEASRFITFFTDSDVVPALFVGPVLELVRKAVLDEKKFVSTLVTLFVGINVDTVSEQAMNDWAAALIEFKYYGSWVNLSTWKACIENENEQQDPSCPSNNDPEPTWTVDTNRQKLFKSEPFLRKRDMATIKQQHNIQDTYMRFISESVPSEQAAEAIALQNTVHLVAASTLVTSDMSSMWLAVLLNKAMSAAVVTKTFGKNEIADKVADFVLAQRAYLEVVYKMAKANDSTLNVETEVDNAMQGWIKFQKRMAKIQDHSEDTSDAPEETWNKFNDDNITADMNSLSIFTAMALSTNHLIAPPSLYARAKEAATTLLHFASCKTVNAFRQADKAAPQAVMRLRSETYKELGSAYVHQLRVMAAVTDMTIGEDESAEAIEKEFTTTANLTVRDAVNRPIVESFIAVLKTIVALRMVCQRLIFVVINGNQTVGKSWFLRAISKKPPPHRDSTQFPMFQPYAPNGIENIDPNHEHVYILDLPGNDSDSDHRRRFVKELYGISTIGIHLFACDTEPRISDKDLQSMRHMFSGCDDVLICLNKALLMAIEWQDPEDATSEAERPLTPIRAKWRQHFEANGVEFDGANTKYHLKITDMNGTYKPCPKPKSTPPSAADQASIVKYNKKVAKKLKKLRANGGEEAQDVVRWLNAVIRKLRATNVPSTDK